jgi:hypothetical protein
VAQTLYRETDESRELRMKVGGAPGDDAGGGADGEEAFEAGPAVDQSVSGAGLKSCCGFTVLVLHFSNHACH